MAVSSERVKQLREEFIPVKKQIDDVDRKYSLDYVEPKLEMPESLNLPALEYHPKTDVELRSLAGEQTYASYLSEVGRLNDGRASDMLKLDKRLIELQEKTRIKLAELLNELNKEMDGVDVKITNAGMLFSTVAERVKAKLRREYESEVQDCNLSAENAAQAIESERGQIEENYARATEEAEERRQAKIQAAYGKLLENEREEQVRVEKYNNVLSEKETKYVASRAKALEAARQAEYDRSYKAKKLYQQMGATGYEENMLWEKYNIFLSHFANFTKREEAMILIQGDSYVKGHLKQYYSTLLDWVNRNVPE